LRLHGGRRDEGRPGGWRGQTPGRTRRETSGHLLRDLRDAVPPPRAGSLHDDHQRPHRPPAASPRWGPQARVGVSDDFLTSPKRQRGMLPRWRFGLSYQPEAPAREPSLALRVGFFPSITWKSPEKKWRQCGYGNASCVRWAFGGNRRDTGSART